MTASGQVKHFRLGVNHRHCSSLRAWSVASTSGPGWRRGDYSRGSEGTAKYAKCATAAMAMDCAKAYGAERGSRPAQKGTNQDAPVTQR